MQTNADKALECRQNADKFKGEIRVITWKVFDCEELSGGYSQGIKVCFTRIEFFYLESV